MYSKTWTTETDWASGERFNVNTSSSPGDLILTGGVYNPNVKLLLHCNGNHNSKTFIDSSLYEHSVATNGQVHINTTNKKFGNASARFDGFDDYLMIPASGDFGFSYSDDFTVSFWVYFITNQPCVFLGGYDNSGWWFEYTGSKLSFRTAGRDERLEANWGPSLNSWHYIHFRATGNTREMYLYYDGNQLAYRDTRHGGYTPSNLLSIGAGYNNGWGRFFDGYLDEIIIRKGESPGGGPPAEEYGKVVGPYGYNRLQDDAGTTVSFNTASWEGASTFTLSGLNANWKLDEASGTIYDETANNNDGAYNGTLYQQSGKIDYALGFDGFDDYVDCGNNDSLQVTGALTIAAWVYLDVLPSTGQKVGCVTKHDAAGNQSSYSLYIGASGYVKFVVSSALNQIGTERSSYIPLTANTWHHIAAVFEPSNELSLYLNGYLEDGVISGAIPANIANSSRDLLIGALYDSGTPSSFFDGKIDDVRIYNRALSRSEVNQLVAITGFKCRAKTAATQPDLITATWSPYIDVSGDELNVSSNRWIEVEAYLETQSDYYSPVLFNLTVASGYFYTDLSASINVSQYQTTDLSASVDVLGHQITDLSASINVIQYQTTDLSASINVSSYQTTDLSASITVSSYQTTDLSASVNVLGHQTTDLSASVDVIQTRETNLSASINVIQYQTTDLSASINVIQYQTTDLSTSIKVSRYQTTDLSASIDISQYQTTDLSASVDVESTHIWTSLSASVDVNTVTFWTDPVVGWFLRQKKIHIDELQNAINTERTRRSMASYSFTQVRLPFRPKKVYIDELRQALEEIVGSQTWTDPVIKRGITTVKGIHIKELRELVNTLEQESIP